jgi:hypothetical protein
VCGLAEEETGLLLTSANMLTILTTLTTLTSRTALPLSYYHYYDC